MEPTWYDGDRLLLLHGSRPRVGRAAVVRLPDGTVAVKRVVRREPGGWWVERDNPAMGVDSWSVGAIADDRVVARVLVRVWPPRWWDGRRGASPGGAPGGWRGGWRGGRRRGRQRRSPRPYRREP